MSRFVLYIPSLYFVFSRLNNLKAWVFHSYYEWLPAIFALLFLTDYPPLVVFMNFIMAYLGFISIYEIGYLINDFYAVKNEDNPRYRINIGSVSIIETIVFVFIRLICFTSVTFYTGALTSVSWWGFYLVLSIVIILHNLIKEKQLKPMSFFVMAVMRFIAPVFFFLEPQILLVLLLAASVNYAFFRLLTYMDSKDLIRMPLRKTSKFKVGFYLIILPLNILLSILTQNIVPITMGSYYLLFMVTNSFLFKD